MSRQLALRLSPAVAFYQVDVAEAEELLIAWRHPLHLPDDQYPTGRPYARPFGSLAFVMEDRGRRAATVVLASTINASVCKTRGFSELPATNRDLVGAGALTSAGFLPMELGIEECASGLLICGLRLPLRWVA